MMLLPTILMILCTFWKDQKETQKDGLNDRVLLFGHLSPPPTAIIAIGIP